MADHEDLDVAGPPLAELLNADPPVEHVPAVDVALLAIAVAADGGRNAPLAPMTFAFQRDDGTTLVYARWLNPETERVEYRLRGRDPA